MKILDSYINWDVDCDNPPSFRLLVDRILPLSEFRFERRGSVFYAEKDGEVRCYHWKGPGNEGGFDGQELDLTMTDGSVIRVKGPWDNGAGEAIKAGFPGGFTDALVAWRLTDFKPLGQGGFFTHIYINTATWLELARKHHVHVHVSKSGFAVLSLYPDAYGKWRRYQRNGLLEIKTYVY